jgi:hypothetical protein
MASQHTAARVYGKKLDQGLAGFVLVLHGNECGNDKSG